MISYAANAVLSKARALYGKGIKENGYSDLLVCKSISDVASYLKRKTSYADVLGDINENMVHRVEIEERLRKKLFVDFELLGRYDISVGEHFFEYIIARAEIEQLMHSLMLIVAGKSGEYIHTIPEFFYSHARVDLRSLKYVNTYDDFLKVIKDSHYYKVLEPLKPKKGQNVDLTLMETALYNHLYEIVFDVINKYVKGKARQELTDFFKLYIDLSNLVRIVRMKKFYALSSEYMNSALIKYGELDVELLRNFINSPNDKQMMIDMKKTKMGKKWFSRGLDVIDKVPLNMRFVKCRHNIRFSLSPPVVLISYIFLKEIEIMNVTNIIEGIKYRLPPEEIRKMLII